MKNFGSVALKELRVALRVEVLESNAGFYIGTVDSEGPVSRESEEYWSTRDEAEQILNSGSWDRRSHP